MNAPQAHPCGAFLCKKFTLNQTLPLLRLYSQCVIIKTKREPCGGECAAIGKTEEKTMEASTVYFTDFRCPVGTSLTEKLRRLCLAAGIKNIDMDGKFVAIKMHFGELGNLAFLRPNYAKVVADLCKEQGGLPFLTDCNTLYPGSRKNALEHLTCAQTNGFWPMTTGCQILIGDGTSGKFKGIFYNPTETKDQVIDPATDLSMTAVDDGTLDEIIYSFGGDEDVEDAAVLVLNKKDLKAFAKLRDKQGRKVYTIVNHGNTGTIDGVPYVINSACGAVTDAQTKAIVYCMAYGPLSNYEMAIFSDIDARKSLDYKFKQGQIAYRADIFAGGAVAAHNGFIRVKRPASA